MKAQGRLAGLIFALVWLSCSWFGAWEWNPNSLTRLFAAMTIVEDGSAQIDRYAPLTMDKAQFGEHFYLDKAPGITLMALPAVAVADRLSGETGHDVSLSMYSPPADRFLRLRMRLATASGAAVLTALAAVCVFLMGARTGGSNAAGAFAAAAFALGTPMWGWSTSLFGHAPVAALFAIAIWAVWRGTEGPRPSRWHAVVAGAALGWAVAVEYTAVLGGAIIGVWALARLWRYAPAVRWPAIGAAVVPAVAALLILIGYNLFAFGDPIRLGYQGVVGFEGMQQGLFGLTWPKGERLWGVTLGLKRGMLWVAPVLLVALPGIARLIWVRGQRDLGGLALAGGVAYILYNASYFYWDGGNSTGPRHAVPAIAFLAIGLAPAWSLFRHVLWRAVLLAGLTLSILINLVIASAEITSGGTSDNPLWDDVFRGRFVPGQLRTIPSEWFDWSPWQGLFLYIGIAAVLGIAIVRSARRA
ncbi:hypothetical protein [Sphingomonas sp. RS2018]